MLNVADVANWYGVSTAFLVKAFDRMGYDGLRAESAVSDPAVDAFERVYGAKIRAARPPGVDTADTAPVWKPKPHMMRVAHARVTGKRDARTGFREKALLDDPGLVHAIDAAGTWDGDPWRGEVVPGGVHFYGGPINSGPTAACGWVHMRAVLGEQFVPADDPVKAGQCPQCSAAVAQGKGFRTSPHQRGYRSYFCEAYLQVRIDGRVEVQECFLGDFHRGPHRTRDGAQWDIGFDDFVPAPLDANRRITKAS